MNRNQKIALIVIALIGVYLVINQLINDFEFIL